MYASFDFLKEISQTVAKQYSLENAGLIYNIL